MQEENKTNTSNNPRKPVLVKLDLQQGEAIPTRELPDKKELTATQKFWIMFRKISIIFFGILLIIVAVLYFFFCKVRNTEPQNIFPGVSFSYVYPKYVQKGDENTIEVTIINLNSGQDFNGIITLISSDSNTPISPLPGQNLSVTIKDLHFNDRATGKIEFTLPERSSTSEVTYYFQVYKLDGTPYVSVNNTFYKSNENTLKVFPIPFVTTSILAITGSISFLFTVITSSDQLKKFWGG